MKKILLTIWMALTFLISFSQGFTPPRSSSAITVQDSRYRALLNFYFTHTHGLTMNGGLDSLGMSFYEDSTGHIWYRDTILTGGHKWSMVLKTGDAGNGTVTKIIAGYGFLPLTITDSGTLVLDTATLNNLWVRRRDSTVVFVTPTQMNSQGFLKTIAGITAGGDLNGTYPNPTINLNAVTFAKIQQIPAFTFVGNPQASTANPQASYFGYGLKWNNDSIKVDTTTLKSVFIGSGGVSGITQLTGDGTTPAGGGIQPFTLSTVNGNVGSFGSASSAATFTANAKGLITAAGNIPIQITESQVTNLTTDLSNKLSTVLATGNIIIGNGSNVAVAALPSGDWTINTVGVNTIGANVVTYSKIQASSQQALLGATSPGNYQEIILGSNLSMSGNTLNAAGGGSGGGTLVNLGAGYRAGFPTTNNLRTFFGSTYIGIDSSSNSNGLTFSMLPGTANTLFGYNGSGSPTNIIGGANVSIVSGTISVPGVALLAANQTFTGTNTFNGGITLGSTVAFATDNTWSIGNSSAGANSIWSHFFSSDGDLVILAGLSSRVLISTGSGTAGIWASNGQLQLSKYITSTSFTGTPTSILEVDASGNAIQGPLSSLSQWTLTGTHLYPNSTSDSVCIGCTTPTASLTVNGEGVFTQVNNVAGNGGSLIGVNQTFTQQAPANGASLTLTGYQSNVNALAGDSVGQITFFYANSVEPAAYVNTGFGFVTYGGTKPNYGSFTDYLVPDGTVNGFHLGFRSLLNSAVSGNFALYLQGTAPAYINGPVLLGSNTVPPSAQLVGTSTTQGWLLPRMNTTQQNAISSPAAGLVIYNTDSANFTYYNTAWHQFGSGSGGSCSNCYDSLMLLASDTAIVFKRVNGTMDTVSFSGFGSVGGGGGSISLTTTGTSGASTLSGSVLNIPQYQGAITLTTTGTSGAATLIGNTLNVPQYTGGGSTPTLQQVLTAGATLTGANTVTNTGQILTVALGGSGTFKFTGMGGDTTNAVGIAFFAPDSSLRKGTFAAIAAEIAPYLPGTTIFVGNLLRTGGTDSISFGGRANQNTNASLANLYSLTFDSVGAGFKMNGLLQGSAGKLLIHQNDSSFAQLTLGSGFSIGAGGVLNFSGSGVTAVGTFSGSSIANGASISGTTITFGPADGTNPGMIKASGSQTLGATLTLTNAPIFTTTSATGAVWQATNTSGQGGWGSVVTSGTYTPTYINVANVASTTSTTSYYTRNGNIIHVVAIGQLSLTAAATSTELSISLPITSSTSGAAGIGTWQANGNGLTTAVTGIVNGGTTTTANWYFYSTGTFTGLQDFVVQFDYSL